MKRTTASQAGSLLVITLWTVTLLSVFAIAIARYLSVELRVMKYRLAHEQAKAMARSGVYVAMARLVHDGTHGDETYDWLGDSDWAHVQADGTDAFAVWEVRSAASVVRVEVVDEQRKLDINRIGDDDKTRLAVESLLDASMMSWIRDYVDADSTDSGGGGRELDDSVIPPYAAKNRPLAACAELLSIPVLADVQLRSRIADFCSLVSPHYSGSGKMNINTVKAEVLDALGLTQGVTTIGQLRDADPQTHAQPTEFQDGGAILAAFPAGGWQPDAASGQDDLVAGMGVTSQSFTVTATGEAVVFPQRPQSPNAVYRVRAVVRRGCDAQKPCIIAWREG